MKRFLHALAALWPKRKEAGRPPATPTSTGLRQHLAAVIRMERHVSECTDIQSRKRHAVTSDAHPARREVKRSGLTANRPESCDARHPFRKAGSQPVGVSDSTVRRINEYTTNLLDESPNQQFVESPNQPHNLPRIPQPMPLLTILMLVFFMCLMAAKQVSAQAEPAAAAAIKPLQIGDTIPEELWHLPLQVVNHPEGKDTITLNDYMGKLVILDFWATWCAPCISSLYKLDTLQAQFAEELAVIPTTYEEADKVAPFFAEKGWSLPTATSETMLKSYFPYQSIPHQVWVKDGKLLAVASHEYANLDYITKVLKGEEVDFNHKVEVAFDKSKPLLINGNGGGGDNLLYHSMVTKAIDANVSGVTFDEKSLLIYNRDIAGIFTFLYRDEIEWSARFNRLRLEIDDSMIGKVYLYRKIIKQDSVWDNVVSIDDRRNNLYCYNLAFPEEVGMEGIMEYARHDVNRFFGKYLNVSAKVEQRYVKCYVLTRLPGSSLSTIKSDTSFYKSDGKATYFKFHNTPYSRFLSVFAERNRFSKYPIVDSTGYTGNIDMEFNSKLDNLVAVKKELNRHGFDIVEDMRTVKMLILYHPYN